jgi:hypothetical protein
VTPLRGALGHDRTSNHPMTMPYRAALAVLLLVTALTYHGALRNNFVWDDIQTIVNNRAIDSITSLPSWFARTDTSYRLIMTISFGLDVTLWGRNPGAFHAVNIAIHLGVILLTYVLALRIWINPWSALIAAGLVAWHPLNAEAVNYISARSSLLSTLFTLAAVALWARAFDRRRLDGLWMVISILFGALAMWTKETSVVLPLLIMAWDRVTSEQAQSWRLTIQRSLPWWALSAIYLAWRSFLLAGTLTNSPVGDGMWQPILFVLKIWLVSLWSWFVPVGWAIDHGWPWHIGFGEGAALATGAIAAAAGTAAVFRWDRRCGWCLAWFWCSLAPLAALPWVSRLTLYQDHRVYLGQIGLAVAGGELIRRVAAAVPSTRGRLIGIGIPAALLATMAIHTTVSRIPVWRDADTLWAYTLSRYPTSVLARNHAALRRLEAGELAAAREQFETSAAFTPDFPVTHNYLGIVYARLGDVDRAIAEFTTAIKLSPSFVSAHMNLGNAYEKIGRLDLALTAYEQGVPDKLWAVDLIERAGKLLERMGQPDEAQARYRRILAIEPDHHGANSQLNETPP